MAVVQMPTGSWLNADRHVTIFRAGWSEPAGARPQLRLLTIVVLETRVGLLSGTELDVTVPGPRIRRGVRTGGSAAMTLAISTGKVDITPAPGALMAGYGAEDEPRVA